jgi:hypothetical protein
MLVASIALVVAVATALAWWCGWGFARLMLPTTLLPFRRLLAPLAGYAMNDGCCRLLECSHSCRTE